MRGQIYAGRFLGAPLLLTRSWFVAFAVLVALSVVGYPFVLTSSAPATIVLLALATAAIFFAGLLLHELGHALAARRVGLPVRDITMRALGGVTQTPGRARSAADEALFVGAGPGVSVALGVALLLPALFLSGRTPGHVLLAWSGLMQLGAAAVNLLPVGTIDGGRLLHAARAVAPDKRALAVAAVWCAWLATVALTIIAGVLANRL